MDVVWPLIDGLGSIKCLNDYACRGISFPIPESDDAYTLVCNDSFECSKSTVYCPMRFVCAYILLFLIER